MKKMCVLVVLVCCSAVVMATDIKFTPEGATGGCSYAGISSTSGTFSFTQDIFIDNVQGAGTDYLCGMSVYIPNLSLSNYIGSEGEGTGDITTNGEVQIKNGENVLLSGTLSDDTYRAIFTTSLMYSKVLDDIYVTSVDHSTVSGFLNGISVGTYLDLSLSLTSGSSFDTMITGTGSGPSTFSGQMTVVPEPMAVCLLGLGGLILRKQRKNS